MPPPGDRASAPSKDRDRQGAANAGAGNKGSSAGASKGAAAGASKGAAAGASKGAAAGASKGAAAGASKGAAAGPGNKGAAPAAEKSQGFFGGVKDFFSGGAKSTSGPTADNRPKARPDIVKVGSGKNLSYMDTRTGKVTAAPEYGAFSLRGLTSTDPANVARNRYGREGLEAMRSARDARDGPDRAERGIASLVTPAAPAEPPPTGSIEDILGGSRPTDLAMLGAPTTPMAPIFVDSPVYGVGMPMGEQGMLGYGSAFSAAPGTPQLSMMDLIDLFGTYPNLGR
jgi:hypothetical protein